MRTVRGSEAKALIETQLAAHNGGILSALSNYDLSNAVRAWHGTIRAIEEFINVPLFGIDDERLLTWLLAIPLDDRFLRNPDVIWLQVRQALSPHFDAGTVQRFCQLMLQIAAVGRAFRISGQLRFGSGITLDTIAGAIGYLQSRRRHFVSLLYTMPFACKGSAQLHSLDTLNVLLPQVEHSCATITGLHLKLALADALPNFSLEVDGIGAYPSHWLETLDAGFLEPERASIHVMNELRPEQIVVPDMEPVDPQKIFSAAELRNSTKLLAATYEAFGLNDSDFAAMASLVTSLSRRAHDDYVVAIGKAKFRSLLRAQHQIDPAELERLLVNKPGDYAANTNAFEPFIDVGDALVSNVNLLSRFLYAFKNVHLGSRRRFQIHAGFIFEDMVARDLRRMGFDVTEIKRINRKEFDIVATLGDAIYNFQCKNNWIDFSKVESDRALFVRYNRSLANYYARALAKERSREGLLTEKLGRDKIEHFVISRFPVITEDPRIICYNRLDALMYVINPIG